MSFTRRVNRRWASPNTRGAYTLIECLVYVCVVFALLGVGYAAMYRCIDNSVALRRSADDITKSLHAGERWRADMRSAKGPVRLEKSSAEQLLLIPTERGEIAYRFSANEVSRRLQDHPWSVVVSDVKSASVESESRQELTVWRWELELQPRAKAGRVRPLFTFIAVPGKNGSK